MTNLQRKTRFVKPAVCVSEVLRMPLAPCDYRPFTDGSRYRVLACCQACGGAEEM
jgi:hypothetical protein